MIRYDFRALNKEEPDSVYKALHRSVIWRCPTCQGDYRFVIADRHLDDNSCPYCNEGKLLPGYNSLDVTYPELAEEWSNSNDVSPENVSRESMSFTYWDCPSCHGTYRYKIGLREVGDDSYRKPLKGYNTFASRHPELLGEWDYISNYLIADPDEILGSYSKIVWWKCKDCGRRYELSPKAKLLFEKRHMKSCRFCKGNRRKMHHFF